MSGMCKKMWKMWCHGMEKYPPMFMHRMGMHPSMIPHKLAHKGIKIAILMALQERSLSGYAITKHIEDTYGHLLTPDMVYPTLKMLDDMGLITKSEQDNKKMYAITDDGKNSYCKTVAPLLSGWNGWRSGRNRSLSTSTSVSNIKIKEVVLVTVSYVIPQ